MEAVHQDYETPRTAAGLRDTRADGGQRDVHFARDRVTIRRQLRGIRMQIAVPMVAYRGVVLSLFHTPKGEACYRVTLRHADPDLSVVLTEAYDEAAVMSEWRAWAQQLAQAPLLEREEGQLEDSREPLPAPRRRGGRSSSRSRGRFANRRKLGNFESELRLYCNEREIICYE
jgi:hypothetical protein